MSRVLRMHFRGQEDDRPALLDVATFLWDVNLLYQTSVLGAAIEYEGTAVPFSSPWYFTRSSHRWLRSKHRLHIEHVRHDSPLDLSVIVPLTGAAIAGVVGVATVLKAKLELRKLRLEIEKLEADRRASELVSEKKLHDDMTLLRNDPEFRRRLRVSHAEGAYERIAARVEKASIQIEELDIEATEVDFVLSHRLREGEEE